MSDIRAQAEQSDMACELAEALRPFVFDWEQAVGDLEDHTAEDMADLELGVTVDRATVERAARALERYDDPEPRLPDCTTFGPDCACNQVYRS